MRDFIHNFMEHNGVPVSRTSAECMDYLQNVKGFTFNVARGVLGRAVAKGYIIVSSTVPVKTYNL